MTAGTTRRIDLGGLRDLVTGEIATPKDERWHVALQYWGLLGTKARFVVVPQTAEDVDATLSWADAHGVHVESRGEVLVATW